MTHFTSENMPGILQKALYGVYYRQFPNRCIKSILLSVKEDKQFKTFCLYDPRLAHHDFLPGSIM